MQQERIVYQKYHCHTCNQPFSVPKPEEDAEVKCKSIAVKLLGPTCNDDFVEELEGATYEVLRGQNAQGNIQFASFEVVGDQL